MLNNNHIPESNQDYLFNQLGIQNVQNKNSFNPNNQPILIEEPHHNKYAANDDDDDGFNMTVDTRYQERAAFENSPQVQSHNNQETNIPKTNMPKTKRKLVRANKRGAKTNTRNADNVKKQIEIDIGMDEVAEWGEKGTKINQSDDDSFESDIQKENNVGETKQQEQIRRRIEGKLKKYDNPNYTSSNQSNSSSLSSLKNKAQELKRNNKNVPISMDSSNLAMTGKIQEKIEEEGEGQEDEQQQKKSPHKPTTTITLTKKIESDQESDDPWQNINKDTLAKNEKRNQFMEEMAKDSSNLVNYYRNYPISNDIKEDEEEEPETGFMQKLCACLTPAKKGKSDIEKRILSIAKIKLSNTVEEMGLLKQIWTKITHKKFQRYGEHWNQIGFQGRDPATDLRASGVLSLVQWNSFIDKHGDLQTKFSNFCIEFDIPLALTHIKVTSLLVSSIEKRVIGGQNWDDFQEWYNALICYTFDYITNNGKNLEQLGEFVQKAVQRTRKNIQKSKGQYIKAIKK